MSEVLHLENGPQHAISVNSERGPTMIWRDGDTVTLVMRMSGLEDGVSLSRIEARLQDLSAKAQHDYHLREVFSSASDEGHNDDRDELESRP